MIRVPCTFSGVMLQSLLKSVEICGNDKMYDVARYYEPTATKESLTNRQIVHLLFVLITIYSLVTEYYRTRASIMESRLIRVSSLSAIRLVNFILSPPAISKVRAQFGLP